MSNVPARDKLRQWRISGGLTQARAATRAQVARRTWHLWEQGAAIPTPDAMRRLYLLTQGIVTPNDFYNLPTLLEQAA